jgi:hypothetical protein
MSGQIPRPMGSISLVATLLVWIVSFAAPTITAHADDCLAEPNSSAPAGSHWYYHTDRATQRKCWYIRATGQPAQPTAAQVASDPASDPARPPPAVLIPAEKPATASASGPTSISPGDSTAPSRRIKARVKPQPAYVSGAATGQSALQGAQKANPQTSPALSIQAPAPQAVPSSQTRDPGAPTKSGPTPAWPDPPATTQERAAPPSDTRTESLRPTVDTPASDDAKSTVSDGASTTKPAGTKTSALAMPVEMFAIIALGLVVAGILLRIVMKISVMKIFRAHRQQITTDDHDFDQIDDLAHELDEDQNHRDALSEDLKRSKIPPATDSKPRRPSLVGNDRSDITRVGDSVSNIATQTSMRKHRPIDIDHRELDWRNDRRLRRRGEDQRQHESSRIDPPEPDSIDDRRQGGRRNDQQGSAGGADELLEELSRSLLAPASDPRPHPSSLHVVDENKVHHEEGSPQAPGKIRERDEVLDQLRRDLDRLLQSPKVA